MGMTYEEIEKHYPDEFRRRQNDKLAYRYPRGESYLDMIHRLDQMVFEMDRHREPLLIVAHQGILRLLYAYLMDMPREEAPYVSIPLNTVIKLEPKDLWVRRFLRLLYAFSWTCGAPYVSIPTVKKKRGSSRNPSTTTRSSATTTRRRTSDFIFSHAAGVRLGGRSRR